MTSVGAAPAECYPAGDCMLGRTVGNYKILAQLGEGGMGIVYLGEHPLIGKKVAIKILHPELARSAEAVSRFFQEARSVNAIGHDNIVDIADFARTAEGDTYFIMELLEGETLAGRLKRAGTLEVPLAVDLAAQTASALAAAHARGIIHRDLKPDNIFLTRRSGRENFVKVLDFGIAKLASGGEASHKTRTGVIIGTPGYMAPEQCQGQSDIDGRADVYALGMIIYQALTGHVAFEGTGFTEILIAHLTRPVPPPREQNPFIPEELETLILRCLEKERERRYQSMDDLLAALAPFQAQFYAVGAGSAMRTIVAGDVVPPTPQGLPAVMGGTPIPGAVTPLERPRAWTPMTGVPPTPMPGPRPRRPVTPFQVTVARGTPVPGVPIVRGTPLPGSLVAQTPFPGAAPAAAGTPRPAPEAPWAPYGEVPKADPGVERLEDAPTPPPPAEKRPTTMSGTAGEEEDVPRRRGPLVAAAVALAGVLVVLGWFAIGGKKEPRATIGATPATAPAAPGTPAPPAAPAAAADVGIAFSSTPAGASVVRVDTGAALGTTPFEVRVARGTTPVEVEIGLPGFVRQRTSFVPDRDRAMGVALAPATPEKTAKKTGKKKAKKPVDDLGTLEPEF